jgi:hypothetical protein
MIIIGIDADLHKSGVTIYETETKEILFCKALSWCKLFDLLKENKEYKVYLEAPQLNKKANWHNKFETNRGKLDVTAENVGKNKGAAIIIENILKELNINYQLLKPAGYSLVLKNAKTFKKTTKYNETTNEDARASAAMVFGRKN